MYERVERVERRELIPVGERVDARRRSRSVAVVVRSRCLLRTHSRSSCSSSRSRCFSLLPNVAILNKESVPIINHKSK